MDEENGMVKHSVLHHDGKHPEYRMQVLWRHMSAMQRQITESVYIEMSLADLLNSTRKASGMDPGSQGVIRGWELGCRKVARNFMEPLQSLLGGATAPTTTRAVEGRREEQTSIEYKQLGG